MASRRLMAVDWQGRYAPEGVEGDEVRSARGVDFEQLFERPGFDWTVGWVEGVASGREIAWAVEASLQKDEEEAMWSSMLCRDLVKAWGSRKVAVMRGHAWLGLVVLNARYRDMFEASLGLDKRGVAKVFGSLGPLLFRPVWTIRGHIEAVSLLLAQHGNFRVGLLGPYEGRMDGEVRGDDSMADSLAGDVGPGKGEWLKLGSFLGKMAFAVLPDQERAKPVTYLISTTDDRVRWSVRNVLMGNGPEASRHNLTSSMALDELGVAHAGHRAALSRLKVMVHVMSEGVRVVYISRGMGSSGDCGLDGCLVQDAQQEVVEMWLLAETGAVVRTSCSNEFATVANSWSTKASYYLDSETFASHKQEGREPLGGGDERGRILSVLRGEADCFDQRSMGMAWMHSNA